MKSSDLPENLDFNSFKELLISLRKQYRKTLDLYKKCKEYSEDWKIEREILIYTEEGIRNVSRKMRNKIRAINKLKGVM